MKYPLRPILQEYFIKIKGIKNCYWSSKIDTHTYVYVCMYVCIYIYEYYQIVRCI